MSSLDLTIPRRDAARVRRAAAAITHRGVAEALAVADPPLSIDPTDVRAILLTPERT